MRQQLAFSLLIAGILTLAACQPPQPEAPEAAATPAPDATASSPEPGVIEVMVQDYSFTAPPTLPSGWTTFRLTNSGLEPHFMMLWKMPEGVSFDDFAGVARLFQDQFDGYYNGTATADEMLGGIVGGLPEWFAQVRGMGGVALTSAGQVAESVVMLEPGEYVMECYVINAEGKVHNLLGMLRPLIVTEATTDAEPPVATARVTLSNYSMAVEGELTAGRNIVAVHATEDGEGFVGHDVNVARLTPETDIAAVAAWMGFVDGLRPPQPAEFLGGADHVAAGRTGYFIVDLTPGRYAFVSEGFATRGMIHEFVIE